MRQIIVGETDINLKYIYFVIYLIDGMSPALGEAGNVPSINVNNTGWQSNDISPLEDCGFGNYRALLSDNVLNTVGNIILSTYQTENTLISQGEPIQVVQNLSLIPIFEDPTSPPTVLTYVSLPEAEQYFNTRLYSDAWYQASQKDKIASLCMATRDIEQLNFIGQKADSAQPLSFPRIITYTNPMAPVYVSLGGVVIYNDPWNNVPNPMGATATSITFAPPEINFACCEIAYNYLDGIEIEAEMNRIIVDSQRYSEVHEINSAVSVNEAKRAGINSNKAWIYIRPYLYDGYQLSLMK